MAIVKTDDKHYKAIADTIRGGVVQRMEHLGDEEAKKLTEAYKSCTLLPSEMSVVLNAAFEIVSNVGKKEGTKDEYDRFWDAFQQNGNRSNYSYAFWNEGWNDECYNPKYPLVGVDCGNCFYLSEVTDTKVDIHFTSTNSTAVFRQSKIKTIRKIILDSNTTLYRWFENCRDLENVTFDGILETNNPNLQHSTKITHDSIMSLINSLADKTTDTSGVSWIVTLGNDNIAKLTEEELAIIENKGWNYV